MKNTIMSFSVVISIATLLLHPSFITGAQSSAAIGVCFGGYADNLPTKSETIDLYKLNNIKKMRIYDPDPTETLQALRGSNIDLILGIANENLQALENQTAATQWVQNHVLNYVPSVSFRYIAVGNEVLPSDERIRYILPAMNNIYKAISSAGLQGQIKVSTAIDLRLLEYDYNHPSRATFSKAARPHVEPIIGFLLRIDSPILVNVYPYFTYIYNAQSIQLSYALFTSREDVMHDGELGYRNLFDALLDAMYSAVEKVGGGSEGLEIVVSESGWPSDKGTWATVKNAGTYYQNLIEHVNEGTPKRPGRAVETYLFAVFDENLKPGDGTEKHYGLFYPSKVPKYQLTFG